jgi:hypothetical protein
MVPTSGGKRKMADASVRPRANAAAGLVQSSRLYGLGVLIAVVLAPVAGGFSPVGAGTTCFSATISAKSALVSNPLLTSEMSLSDDRRLAVVLKSMESDDNRTTSEFGVYIVVERTNGVRP